MPLPTIDPAMPLDAVRARFRVLGLIERSVGVSHVYLLPSDDTRMFVILHAVGRGAQIYLYPEALRRPAGSTQWFYSLLESAGFGMGSKLGPSISLPLEEPAQMATFWPAFARLVRGDQAERDAVPSTSPTFT